MHLRRVVGESMEPVLFSGQLVLAWRRRPRLGDIVLVRVGGLDMLKRIAGARDSKLWLLGDNRADSLDSRRLGWIERDAVIGVVPRWLAR